MLVNLPTDFGKSLIFQCLPIVADGVHDIPRGSTVIVVAVISSLRSLMEDQVQCLKILSEYTGYCDHGCGRSRNYSAGLKWKPHLILSVQFAAYFRKPNKQFSGSRSLAGDFGRR